MTASDGGCIRKVIVSAISVLKMVKFLLVIILCSGSASVYAESSFDNKSKELKALQKAIKHQQVVLNKKHSQKTKELESVRKIEKSIGQLLSSIHVTDKQLSQFESDIKKLSEEQNRRLISLELQQDSMVAEIQSAYTISRQHRIKLMLNQKNPAEINRLLIYHGYLSRARQETIIAVQHKIEDLEKLTSVIDRKKADSLALIGKKQVKLAKLELQKSERKKAIKSLNVQLNKHGRRLKTLEKNSEDLTGLIASLREALADIPQATRQESFKSLKGKLAWPANGRIVQLFGTKLKKSNQMSRGVMIRAKEGGKVKVVSHGRVAFADWLRGFGLLLIVDHGDGFMSLYGHNQSLYKEVGEWVDTGEVVSVLGSSGAQSNSGLYFELRHDGDPVDPLQWCRGKPG